MTAQAGYDRQLQLQSRILGLPLMVAAVLTLLWRQAPSVHEFSAGVSPKFWGLQVFPTTRRAATGVHIRLKAGASILLRLKIQISELSKSCENRL